MAMILAAVFAILFLVFVFLGPFGITLPSDVQPPPEEAYGGAQRLANMIETGDQMVSYLLSLGVGLSIVAGFVLRIGEEKSVVRSWPEGIALAFFFGLICLSFYYGVWARVILMDAAVSGPQAATALDFAIAGTSIPLALAAACVIFLATSRVLGEIVGG